MGRTSTPTSNAESYPLGVGCRIAACRLGACVLGLAVAWWAPSALAEPGDRWGDGELRLGIRWTDVAGREAKFRQHLDLGDGVRLLDLRLDWRDLSKETSPDGSPSNDSSPDARSFADRISLELAGWGGDPLETLHLAVARRGRYDFRLDHSKAATFYDDVILPLEDSNPALWNAGDFRRFDFDRVRDRAELDLALGTASTLRLGLERRTREGLSVATREVARDGFELDNPVDETTHVLRVGFEHAWKRATLILEERLEETDNAFELTLPGPSLGEDPEDGIQVDQWLLRQPLDLTLRQHGLTLKARPGDRWLVQIAAVVQDLAMDFSLEEDLVGTDLGGDSLTTSARGGGTVDHEATLIDLDLSWLLGDRWALVASARHHRVDQVGRQDLTRSTEAQARTTTTESVEEWSIETTAVELGVETHLTRTLTLTLGLVSETRQTDILDSTELLRSATPQDTDHEGLFATLAWQPSSRLKLDAELEESSFDEPFSFTAPSDRRRVRVRARYRSDRGWRGDATWVEQRLDNPKYTWRADRRQLALRLGYQGSKLDLWAGAMTLDSDRQADRRVFTTPGFLGGLTFVVPVLDQGDSHVLDGRFRYRHGPRLSLGAEARRVTQRGSFGLERSDLRGWLEVGVGRGLTLGFAYRWIDSDERRDDFDDYRAEIVEISLAARW